MFFLIYLINSFAAGRTFFCGLLSKHVFGLVWVAFAFAFAGAREPTCVFSASVHRMHVSPRFSHGLQVTLLGVMISSLRSVLYLLLRFSFFYDTAKLK